MTDILYLHNSSLISGGERSLLQLWAGLDRRVYTPHVCLPSDGPFAAAARALGVDVVVWQAPSLRPWNLPRLGMAMRALLAVVRQHRIAIIHSYTPRNNLLASLAGKLCRVPVIWHERNLIWGTEKDVSARWLWLADAVICNSRAVARRFHRRPGGVPGKVHTILNGVDLEHFTPSVDREAAKAVLGWSGKKVLGLVSNLEPRKGVELFLEVAALIAHSRQDVLFVVVGGCYGSGPGREEGLRFLASSYGLDGKIVWAGFQADVRPYLAACDVSCHVTEQEACSRAILEAMAMGIPVMALAEGGNPELVVDQKTGVLVPGRDPVVAASRVLTLVDHEAVCQEMGRAARARAEAVFDIRRNTQATVALYAALLERPA